MFQVNSYTNAVQLNNDVAMDAAGDFVITWQSAPQDGDFYGIYAQRYNSAGVAQGTEFRVNTYTTNNQSQPTALMDAAGDFVITWQSFPLRMAAITESMPSVTMPPVYGIR